MNNLDYREYYRRNLPHLQPRGATFLINFRLAGSLPAEVVKRFRVEALELEGRLSSIRDEKEKHLLRNNEEQRLFGK